MSRHRRRTGRFLTAHFLKEAGLRTVVLEAARVGSGQTQNTSAKITAQHGLIYSRLIEQFGEERARQYAQANQQAIETYRHLIAERQIACDFADAPAYLYATHAPEALEQEYEAARRLGLPASLAREDAAHELPFVISQALRFDGQACFHPLRFLRAVAEPLEIYEQTPVLELQAARYVRGRLGLCRKDCLCLPLPLYQHAGLLLSADASGAQLYPCSENAPP
jgi:glycine/D-amino acid oxidase-like deaminating enzyme